jgi:hypothetical protein
MAADPDRAPFVQPWPDCMVPDGTLACAGYRALDVALDELRHACAFQADVIVAGTKRIVALEAELRKARGEEPLHEYFVQPPSEREDELKTRPVKLGGYTYDSSEAFSRAMGMAALRLSVTGQSDIPVADIIRWFQCIAANGETLDSDG